jgi:PST family polysaccharide transporter
MTATSSPPGSDVSDPESAGSDSKSLSSSVRRGALWVIASNVLLRLGNVLITAVVAHILSPHDFGVFAVALTVFAIVSSLGELGVSACLMRADLDIDKLAPTVATVSVTSCTILAVAMAVFARPVAAALGSAAAAGPVRVMSLAVFLLGVFAVPNAQLMRDFKQGKIFLANAIGFVPSTVLLIVLAESGSGALAFAWSMVVRQFVVGCVLIAVAPRHYRPGLTRSALSVILRFGIPLAGANFVNYILLNVDYALVGHLMGASALGVYMLAFTVASWPYSVLGAAINNVSMPAFSRVKHDATLLKGAMAAGVSGVSLIAMPMCAMAIALARPIILTVYGAKWAAAANVLVVLSFYGAVFILCLLFANMLTALGRTKFLLGLQLIWIGTLVPAMALGVHKDGIVGAAYAHVAVIIPIVLPTYLLALKRITGVRIAALGKAALPAVLASSAAALGARAAASQLDSPLAQLAAGLAAGGVIYVICAGRQVITVLLPGQIAERILPFYSSAARLVGLPAGGGAKHSAKYRRALAGDVLEDTGPMRGDIPVDRGALNADRAEVMAPLLANLAYAGPQAGWLTQAVALHERVLADRERLLGPDHPHTLASRHNLAHAYRQTGWLTKAIPLYEQTLAGWTRLLGSDHPRTLRSNNYLAAAYCEAGRLAEAIHLYERTLADRWRLLGLGHPSTVRSSSYLAAAYRAAGRLAEAVPLYEQAFTGWRQLLGPDDPSTLRSGNHLAVAYSEVGRLAEAVPLYEQTLAGCRRVLGNNHPLTRKVRRNLSVTQKLSLQRYLSGPGHPSRPVQRPQLGIARFNPCSVRGAMPYEGE